MKSNTTVTTARITRTISQPAKSSPQRRVPDAKATEAGRSASSANPVDTPAMVPSMKPDDSFFHWAAVINLR